MPEDDKDALEALDALESEAKEWEKDAEIERILNSFRLDAYVPPCSPPPLPPLPPLATPQAYRETNNPAATPS